MIITKEYIESIMTKEKGISNKYSWNLYRYLKNFIGKEVWAYKAPNGRIFLAIFKKPEGIGHDNYGNFVNTIQTTDVKVRVSYYSWANEDFSSYTEITNTFFEEYKQKGRCAIDKAHDGWLEGAKRRFTEIDSETRKCNWCGAILKKKTRLVEQTYWEVENNPDEKPISQKKIIN